MARHNQGAGCRQAERWDVSAGRSASRRWKHVRAAVNCIRPVRSAGDGAALQSRSRRRLGLRGRNDADFDARVSSGTTIITCSPPRACCPRGTAAACLGAVATTSPGAPACVEGNGTVVGHCSAGRTQSCLAACPFWTPCPDQGVSAFARSHASGSYGYHQRWQSLRSVRSRKSRRIASTQQ